MKKRVLSLLTALLAMLLLVACTPGTPDNPSDPSNDDSAFSLNTTEEYVVVISEYASDSEKAAARVVRDAIEKAYGARPAISSDWLKDSPTEEEIAARREILIGQADRSESTAAKQALGDNTYLIRVDGNKLIILGDTPEETLDAAEYFVDQILYDDAGQLVQSLRSDFVYMYKDIPVLVDTVYDPDDLVVANIVATEYPYLADPTGKADSTRAIQRALDDLHEQGGGTVFLPVGTYLVKSTITVPTGCMLKGDWQDPDTTDTPQYGTVIFAKTPVLDEDYLADRTRGPLFDLTSNCALDGLTIYYPDQNAKNVVKYGYSIYSQAPSCVTISNVTLLNSYRGIGIDVHADQSHELVQIDGVRMTALEVGVEMYHSTEVGNSVDIRISPSYWAQAGEGYACSDKAALTKYCRENTVAMKFNGLDDTHLSELFIEGCRTAIYMPSGYTTHDFWGVIYDVTIEDCSYGIVAESLNGAGGAAIAKAVIDASEVAVYSSASTGAMKLCDVTTVGKGDIVAVGNARIYEDLTDVSNYSIKHATYQKPVSKLYVAPVRSYSKTKTDISPILQETLDEAAATGGVVYIPAGVYSVYQTISVPAGVELRGSAPFFMRDSQSASQGIDGTVLLTYVEDDATVELNQNAGVNGLRIFCAVNSPDDARDLLGEDDPVVYSQVAIKGQGNGVYAHNVVLTTTFNGIDFTGCDNHSVKQAFGAVWGDFIIAGGKNGVIEQCLTNQHFISRQHFGKENLLNAQYCSDWSVNISSEVMATTRDEVRRVYGDMVYLIDAENESVSNIFTYGPRSLVVCDHSSATLLNISSDFHGMGPMFDIKNGSDAVAVNALRSANESIGCDESSDFLMINRIAISRFNEPNFDSSNGNIDQSVYKNITDKVTINDGSKAVTGATVHTGAYTKTGGNALYHKASVSTDAVVTIYDQTFAAIDATKYMNENGYLHMWVYVEDMTSSVWSGWITLSGNGGSQRWSTICYITHNGWNELWLPMTGAQGTLKGSVTHLTISDQRSAKLQHSDYYFDDIYLCNATSNNPKAINRSAAMEVTPAPEVQISPLPTGKPGMLLSCDSLYGVQARSTPVRVLTDPDYVKEGTGSWMLTTAGIKQLYFNLKSRNINSYMETGYLHLWVYVEDVKALTGGQIELTSSGVNDQQEISWNVTSYVRQSGWNELWLPLSNPEEKSGTFNPSHLNYFRIYAFCSRSTTVCMDDVRICYHSQESDVPADDLPATETVIFTPGQESEAPYLYDNSGSSLMYGKRFSDAHRSFTYGYDIYDYSRVTSLTWTASTSQELLLQVSTDNANWVDVYRYDGEARGLSEEKRTYDLMKFVDTNSPSKMLYVKVADAYNTDGYGGAVSGSATVTLKVTYAGGEGDVFKGEKPEPTDPTDPVELPEPETPRPDGTVDQKLMVHDCETTEGAVMTYVPVSLNTDKTYVKEGSASWMRSGSTREYVALNFGPLDISDYMKDGYLHFWVYVTDYNLVPGGQIELTSSGSADNNEIHWDATTYITGDGWNEVFLPLNQGKENPENAKFDPTAANYIRFYCGTSDGKYNTMYFDDFYFCTMK